MGRVIQAILEFFRRLLGRKPGVPAEPERNLLYTHPDADTESEDDDTPATAPDTEEEPMGQPILERGAADKEAVRRLQMLLNKNGESLTVDGDFGPGTERAVQSFQTSYELTANGVVDANTWTFLERPPFGKDVTYRGVPLPPSQGVPGNSGVAKAWNAYGNLLGMLAGELGISAGAACAVLAVESAGDGFWNGRMVIRFENHIFYKYWGKAHPDEFNAHFRMNATDRWKGHMWWPGEGPWRSLHTGSDSQDEEYAVLAFARNLDDEAALKSISMGAPQIMGFNCEKVGFNTARAMFDAFSVDETAHVLGLFDFIRSDHKMIRYLRTGNWAGFADIYNGSGQAEAYGGNIRDAVEQAKKVGIP